MFMPLADLRLQHLKVYPPDLFPEGGLMRPKRIHPQSSNDSASIMDHEKDKHPLRDKPDISRNRA
jgi:hypothetical protein